MPRHRTPIAELRLQGSPHLRRALKRDANLPDIPPGDAAEITRIDKLIDRALRECSAGSAVGPKQKANPAFRNLQTLIACREVLRGRARLAIRKSADSLLKSVDSLLAAPADGKPS